eukprot:362896-Chlamydomonas_euryale.AAC.9
MPPNSRAKKKSPAKHHAEPPHLAMQSHPTLEVVSISELLDVLQVVAPNTPHIAHGQPAAIPTRCNRCGIASQCLPGASTDKHRNHDAEVEASDPYPIRSDLRWRRDLDRIGRSWLVAPGVSRVAPQGDVVRVARKRGPGHIRTPPTSLAKYGTARS